MMNNFDLKKIAESLVETFKQAGEESVNLYEK